LTGRTAVSFRGIIGCNPGASPVPGRKVVSPKKSKNAPMKITAAIQNKNSRFQLFFIR